MISTIGIIITMLSLFNHLFSCYSFHLHSIVNLTIISGIFLIIISGGCFLVTLIPRIKNKENKKSSYLFFGDLAKSSPQKIAEYYEKIDNIDKDLVGQIYINARIAQKKMQYCTWGLKIFVWGCSFILIRILIFIFC